MIENAQQAELQDDDEDIQIKIVEDPPEGEAKSGDDELENYTKSVSKRINKLNAKNKAAEDRAAQLEQIALAKENELQQYRAYTAQQEQTVLAKETETIHAKESQVDDVYKKAVASGDPDLMSKATTLKNDIAIQKERLRVQTARQQVVDAQTQDQGQYQAYNEQANQPAQPAEVAPTEEALTWYERNSWYGNSENSEHTQATQFAYFTHFNLINEGFEPDSDDYYSELDSRVGKVYPTLANAGGSGDGTVVQSGSRPAVQRVSSSTSQGGRQQTRENSRSGVTFSNSEVERLKGLKPHNMTMETWLRHVAKEKQKIAAREEK